MDVPVLRNSVVVELPEATVAYRISPHAVDDSDDGIPVACPISMPISRLVSQSASDEITTEENNDRSQNNCSEYVMSEREKDSSSNGSSSASSLGSQKGGTREAYSKSCAFDFESKQRSGTNKISHSLEFPTSRTKLGNSLDVSHSNRRLKSQEFQMSYSFDPNTESDRGMGIKFGSWGKSSGESAVKKASEKVLKEQKAVAALEKEMESAVKDVEMLVASTSRDPRFVTKATVELKAKTTERSGSWGRKSAAASDLLIRNSEPHNQEFKKSVQETVLNLPSKVKKLLIGDKPFKSDESNSKEKKRTDAFGSWGKNAGKNLQQFLRDSDHMKKSQSFERRVSFNRDVTVFADPETPRRPISRLITLKSGDYSFLLEAIGDEYSDLEANAAAAGSDTRQAVAGKAGGRGREGLQPVSESAQGDEPPKPRLRGHRVSLS